DSEGCRVDIAALKLTVYNRLAYVGGLCWSTKVAVGEDIPLSFKGVHIAAHEIAHLLGAVHDGSGPISYIPGHPGAKKCPWTDGYIMSYIDGGEKNFRFSVKGRSLEGSLFQDAQQLASLTVDDGSDGLEVHGILSRTLRIAPHPVAPRSTDGQMAHLLFVVEELEPNGEDEIITYQGLHPESEQLLTARLIYAHVRLATPNYASSTGRCRSSLGSKHDGSGPARFIRGHPGAIACPWKWGYIMSYVNGGKKHFRFSECSQAQMRAVLGSRKDLPRSSEELK
ncbi:hypothetical protein HPB47_012748, partial [Ixodes persulcatus]